MAKLTSVKVIGNKIEVDGATYERTDGDVMAGDIVQCFERGEGFTLGAFYEVSEIDSDRDFVIIDDDGDERYRYQHDSDFLHFRKVAAAKEAKRPKLAVGDYAEVVGGGNGLSNIGDIVKIVEDDGSNIPFRIENLNGEYAGYKKAENLAPVTPEEVAEAEQTAKWAAIGRKVGEFKNGDIVESLGICNGHQKGAIGVVTGADGTDRPFVEATYEDGILRSLYTRVKLIAPVESVVNLRGAGA